MVTLDEVVNDVRSSFVGRDVFFSKNEIPKEVAVPEGWVGFGINLQGDPVFPDAWLDFSSELPWVLSLLKGCLIGTAVLGGREVELLYIFHDTNGFYYYIGGKPLGGVALAEVKLKGFPERLLSFYLNVHNGFTFFPAQSMGPQKIENTTCVADFIDEEDVGFAEQWLTVFSNGGGGYLAVDLTSKSAAEGLIWWHEEPAEPELNVNVFDIMDTWISIFLEDTRLRDDLLA
ncbi:SMI1/KNR4 family protein [Pseudomonas tussilaginis]|uniref:hypothetical protein n=1 Tax=Pseudomonas putida TaxID=303 RepID=UPI002363D53F|nr:hypothetical protein [Pseudomonas putida]MDD1976983.1 hypothetical protein [Pseudomonas putida]